MHVHQIRAAVLRKSAVPLRIETLESEGPGDDEVLIAVGASGICHTDTCFIDEWDGEPVVLGHQGAGMVEDLQPPATKEGRRDKAGRPCRAFISGMRDMPGMQKKAPL